MSSGENSEENKQELVNICVEIANICEIHLKDYDKAISHLNESSNFHPEQVTVKKN